jgi:hypothetical protein
LHDWYIHADPKEVKKHRDRERHAKGKDKISKCGWKSRELKNLSKAPVNGENTLCGTPETRENGAKFPVYDQRAA